MEFIKIENDGQHIISTNYWQSSYAANGAFYLSINAGAFRLLVPPAMENAITEWAMAKEVLISIGAWPEANRDTGIEILFEDFTDNPYAIFIGTEQTDRLPLDKDRDRQGEPPRWKFTAWTQAGKVLELPCRFRKVKSIPCLKAWK